MNGWKLRFPLMKDIQLVNKVIEREIDMGIRSVDQYIEENKAKVNPEFRNKFHLMPQIGWMNDPNGFIHYKGKYHLFYQFYPYDSVWGPMHWGHAVSSDGIEWEHLPPALAPDQDYDRGGCFSGTAYVEDDILYLMYTGHTVEDGEVRQVQCLAKSYDGISFEKYKNNPVIYEEHIAGVCSISDFRDPKLFKKDGKYFSVVAANTNDNRGQLLIFESENMTEWSKGKVFFEGKKDQGVMWECPDVFNLNGEDVILMSPIQMEQKGINFTNRSSTVAFIGKINWEDLTFEPKNMQEIDNGMDFYAPQTCLNDEGERIMIAWMQMWDRTNVTHELGHKWSGSMTLPREISIDDNRLFQIPINSVHERLKTKNIKLTPAKGKQEFANDPQYIKLKLNQESYELQLVSDNKEYLTVSYENGLLTLSRERMGHKIVGEEGENYVSRSIKLNDNNMELEIFIDTSSIELFVNGKYCMSTTFYKKHPNRIASIKDLANESIIIVGEFI